MFTEDFIDRLVANNNRLEKENKTLREMLVSYDTQKPINISMDAVLKQEIAQLKAKLELSDNSVNGVLKVSLDRLRIIEQLKEELKRESKFVNDIANNGFDIGVPFGLMKLAREIQAQRKK